MLAAAWCGETLSDPGVYLTHEELQVDEPVWHTRSAVAQGRDNVVDAARAWIDSSLTAIEENVSSAPQEFRLEQNHPNPFNPATKIGFNIQTSGLTSLRVYNVLGQEVARLVHEDLDAGNHEVTFDGAHLASGVYCYQLKSGTSVATKRFVLLK